MRPLTAPFLYFISSIYSCSLPPPAATEPRNYFICFGNFANECAQRVTLSLSVPNEDEVYFMANRSGLHRSTASSRSTRVCNQIICTKIEKILRNFYKFIFSGLEEGAGDWRAGYKFCPKVRSHFACKVAAMQRRMCGFSGILARGPNLPFVYIFRWKRSRHLSLSLSALFLALIPAFPCPSTRLIVQTTRLHWTLFACSRRRQRHRHRRLRRVAFQARRRTCVAVP